MPPQYIPPTRVPTFDLLEGSGFPRGSFRTFAEAKDAVDSWDDNNDWPRETAHFIYYSKREPFSDGTQDYCRCTFYVATNERDDTDDDYLLVVLVPVVPTNTVASPIRARL